MIKLRFIPKLNKIVAQVGREYFNLPTCEHFVMIYDHVPCLPFLNKKVTGNWLECNRKVFDKYIQDHKIVLTYIKLDIYYGKTEKGKDLVCLRGTLPKYVINGITKLISLGK